MNNNFAKKIAIVQLLIDLSYVGALLCCDHILKKKNNQLARKSIIAYASFEYDDANEKKRSMSCSKMKCLFCFIFGL